MLRDSNARVALTLLRLADLDGVGRSRIGVLHLSQEELGEMTRLTRSVVAQILTALETSGLIRRGYRALEIVDVAAPAGYVEARTAA